MYFRFKNTYRLKVKRWKEIFHPNRNQNRNRGSYHTKQILSKKTVPRGKEGCYIIIKKLIHQENITFINIYTPTIIKPKYMKQILDCQD